MVIQTAATAEATEVTPVAARRKRRIPLPSSPKVIVGAALLLFFVLIAIFGPMVSPHAADWQANTTTSTPLPPSGKYWFGTDQQQHDIFSQVLSGGRDTLLIALVGGVIASLLSVGIGVTAGYIGGWVDEVLSAITNIFLALPGLLILMVLMRPLPPGDTSNPLLIGAVIAVTAWAWGARVMRAQTLALRNQDYVESARVIGERKWRIMVFEILPNLLPILASSFIFTVIYGIGTYVALAWLGVIDPSHVTWGTILNNAQTYSALVSGYWWWFVFPALAVALLGIALALLNFGIDEVINPRLRSTRRTKGGPNFQLGLTPVVRRDRAGSAAGHGTDRTDTTDPTPSGPQAHPADVTDGGALR